MKQKKSLLVLVLFILTLAISLPILFSVLNHRTAISSSWSLKMYDTSLSTDQLDPHMFADAVWWHNRYGTNGMEQLVGLFFHRRVRVMAVDYSVSGHHRYDIRVYTWFNIPLINSTLGAVNGEPTVERNKSLNEF